MGFHRVTNFTTDHEQVAQLLERYKKEHERIVLEINQWVFMNTPPPGAGRGHAQIPDRFLKMVDAVFLGPAGADGKPAATSITLRSVADLLLGMDRSVPVVEKPWERQDRFADLQSDLAAGGVVLNDAVLQSTRLKVLRRHRVHAISRRRQAHGRVRQWRLHQEPATVRTWRPTCSHSARPTRAWSLTSSRRTVQTLEAAVAETHGAGKLRSRPAASTRASIWRRRRSARLTREPGSRICWATSHRARPSTGVTAMSK